MTQGALTLLELVLLGLLAGVVGTLAILRRRIFFAVAISHATFPGGVVAALLGGSVLLGQAVFAGVLVAVMAGLSRVRGAGRQASSMVVLTFGFALGLLLSGLFGGGGVPIEALLVGSPLAVSARDVVAVAIVLALSLAGCALWWPRLLLSSIDGAAYRAAGFRLWPMDALALLIIAAGVVVAMPAVGALLGVAVVVVPAVAAAAIVRKWWLVPPVAAALGIGASLLGLWASFAFDVAAGGSIALAHCTIALLAWVGRGARLGSRSGRPVTEREAAVND